MDQFAHRLQRNLHVSPRDRRRPAIGRLPRDEVRDAELWKERRRQIDAGRALERDRLRLDEHLPEGFDRAYVRLRRTGSNADADRHLREIDDRPRNDAACGDEFIEPFARHDHDVGQFTALQLRADPVRASALRRAGACRHRYAGCALEARQGLRECCAEAAGPEDVYLSEGAVWQDGQDRGDDEAASNGQPHYATLFRMCSASASLISV